MQGKFILSVSHSFIFLPFRFAVLFSPLPHGACSKLSSPWLSLLELEYFNVNNSFHALLFFFARDPSLLVESFPLPF